MNGPGPQMKTSRSANGCANRASAATLGRPCTDSSQCTTDNRSGYFAVNSRNAAAKITEFSSRFAYSSVTWPFPCDSADLQIAIIGVIPLPAATSRKSWSKVLGTKVPDGAKTWIFIPGLALSHNQFDAYPSTVRLTVTVRASSVNGELHSE